VTITSDDTLPTPLNSVTIGTPLAPAIDFHFTGLDDLLAFQNPEFGLSAIIDALIMLSDFLSQFDAIGGALNAPIPLVNVSVNDLLSFADKLADALDNFQNDPAGSLQVLDTKISEAFGVDPASNLLVFQLDNFGTPNNSADDILKIQLNLSEGFNKSLNVQIPGIDLGLSAPFDELVDFSGAATLAATGSASLSLHMGIGLNDPEKIYLYNSSGLTGNLTLSGSDMAFRAGLGPFSLSIVDGEASIAGNLSLDFTGAPAQLFDAGGRTRLDTAGALSNVLSALNPDLSAPINVTLPIFFPTESNGLGDITLTGDLTNVESGFVVKTTAGQTVDADAIVLDVSEILDGLLDAFENMGLLDQILFVIDGVDMVLGGVQDALDGEILGFELPLVGDSLADGAHFIQDFRNNFLADFRDGVEQLADPNDDAIKTLLFSLLGEPGLKLLKKANGDVGGTLDDIQKFTNLDTASDVSSSEIWWKFKIGESKPIPNDIGFDIGIPGLGLKTEGDIVFTLGWELDFGFGLSGSDGFFFFIDDPDELKLFIDVTLPNASLTGTLGFLEFTAANKDVNNDGDQTHLSASFAINIVNTLKADDTRLGLSELGRLGFEALVGAEASVELGMTLGLSGDNGGFPEIQADFILDWKIDGDPGVSGIQAINLFNPPASFDFGKSIQSGLERVEFLNVKLDLGSYITEVVGPLVREIKDTTEPVQPIIDIVTTPLPVLSDLGLDITLLDIAKQTGLVDPRLIDALEIILQVVTVINDMEMPDDGSLLVPFGNFTVFDRNNDLFDGLTNFDLGSADFDLDKFSEQILGPGGPLAGLISGLPSGLQDVIGEVAGVAGDIMKGLADKSGVGSKKPFTFPIIEDPSQIFGLLMGTPAVLVAYDMPPLHFEAEFSAFFSIFGPLGVSINLEAELNIDFAFGYDTKGFTDFA
ncbi:MAG TPA: hypothetical protein VFR05_05570, partial [Terriglobia bacterium]|nr:hypothetical protein [Terriglobia bacterium]